MTRVVSVQVMRDSDAWTIAHKISSKELMYRAGKGIFDAGNWKEPVAIVCGKGNNAGDGFVVAKLMKEAGIACSIFLLSDSFSEDGRFYYDQCASSGVTIHKEFDLHELQSFHSILDCIFGTGFKGEPRGIYKDVIYMINNCQAAGTYVVSADINSGLNGDTGLGVTYVRSNLTVSIGDYKYGHFRGLAYEAMQDKVNIDIGIEIQGPYDEI